MKRRLGQHFLFEPQILERIVSSAGLGREDLVVEIGPGKGRMTEMLARQAGRVIAIEYDRYLCEELKTRIGNVKNIEIVCEDVLRYPFNALPPFKVVANIPYYITTPIIFKLLEGGVRLETATLTVQKEVAERIIALPGGKDYGVLSLMVQYYTEPAILFYISRKAFVPPPKVDSAVIHLRRRERPPVIVSDEAMLFRVIKTAFSQRRKTLSNALKPLSRNIRDILEELGIDPKRRAETLTIEDFARITEALKG
ncbi:MAG TPA: ribosomal RNA small subunit methyltransferase A [Nitrospirae bacterium]|nr:ribosomal RNA small subunit methyltransferase A [Nitrospirota bacterium]